MSKNAAARRIVEKLDGPELLPMLGLVAEDGSTPPDDTNVYIFPPPDKGPGAKNPDSKTKPTRRPENLTSPPGLSNRPEPTEEEPKPKPSKPGRKPRPKRPPRPVPPCGTYKAYSRHRRHNEPIDAACLEASRQYGVTAGAEYRARKKGEQEEFKRLISVGVNPESARVLAMVER